MIRRIWSLRDQSPPQCPTLRDGGEDHLRHIPQTLAVQVFPTCRESSVARTRGATHGGGTCVQPSVSASRANPLTRSSKPPAHRTHSRTPAPTRTAEPPQDAFGRHTRLPRFRVRRPECYQPAPKLSIGTTSSALVDTSASASAGVEPGRDQGVPRARSSRRRRRRRSARGRTAPCAHRRAARRRVIPIASSPERTETRPSSHAESTTVSRACARARRCRSRTTARRPARPRRTAGSPRCAGRGRRGGARPPPRPARRPCGDVASSPQQQPRIAQAAAARVHLLGSTRDARPGHEADASLAGRARDRAAPASASPTEGW